MIRVVFLDFDGVLNSRRSRKELGWNKLDPGAVELVNHICEVAGAEVVVSSTWRLKERPDERPWARITRILAENGLRARVRGMTPDLSKRMTVNAGEFYEAVPRGREIEAYLQCDPDVERFVILDDNDDMEHLKPWLIQTDDTIGIMPTHVERAVAMLSRPQPPRHKPVMDTDTKDHSIQPTKGTDR